MHSEPISAVCEDGSNKNEDRELVLAIAPQGGGWQIDSADVPDNITPMLNGTNEESG